MSNPLPTGREQADADTVHAWSMMLKAREHSMSDASPAECTIGPTGDGAAAAMLPVDHGDGCLSFREDAGWQVCDGVSDDIRDFMELYLPMLGSGPSARRVIGHLGQSIDARIATLDGDAYYVTGEENRRHLHRMRALADAVIVGASTVSADDPQLTTRSVDGPNPVRVIIDPTARLASNTGVFTDGQASSLLVHGVDAKPAGKPGLDTLSLPLQEGRFAVSELLDALSSRGLNRLFIEGGGITVTRFLEAGVLNRLQIAVAAVLVGKGRDALQLPGADSMLTALRPPYRLYRMGEDVLWDFDMASAARLREEASLCALQRLL